MEDKDGIMETGDRVSIETEYVGSHVHTAISETFGLVAVNYRFHSPSSSAGTGGNKEITQVRKRNLLTGETLNLVTTMQASKAVGISPRHIRHLASVGRIAGERVDKKWLVNLVSLQAYVHERRTNRAT